MEALEKLWVWLATIDTGQLITVLFIIGITAEAMTAAVAAGRMKMDLFGVITLGALTALGGGTVRNVLLGIYPLTWVEQPLYLLVVVAASTITVRISWLMFQLRKGFLVADAIGLAAFVVVGIQTAVNHGHGFIIACVAAVTTGVFGGVMRDVLSDRVPLVFRKELYASAAIIGTAAWWLMMLAGVPDSVIVLVTVALVLAIRLISLKRGWALPVYEYDDERLAEIDPKYALTSYMYTRARRVPGARRVYRGLKRLKHAREADEHPGAVDQRDRAADEYSDGVIKEADKATDEGTS